ncbi:MAG: RtcB family protein [Thermodesulfobacteriota bacterium]
MDMTRLHQQDEFTWEVRPFGKMRVPAVLFASRRLIEEMDDKVFEQITNVATLPGIVTAAYAMPDAHWGYGFPIGGVAGFDADEGGVISAGGVGFDISCGVRTLRTGLSASEILACQRELARVLERVIPAGVGSTGTLRLNDREMDAMLLGGARWAIKQGFGREEDLAHIEEQGVMAGADPGEVSPQARKRQRDEMGTLGSGNHYLEIQRVAEIHDPETAAAFGLAIGDALVSIHCGSRGLGHQIGTEFLKRMAIAAPRHHIALPDRELACAPLSSRDGRAYLGAMRAAINCALANRQILTHLTRNAFAELLPHADLSLLYDVSHNTCKEEEHLVGSEKRRIFVHRKGATRSLGPGHPELPAAFREVGQPVLIGGTMGTASYILAGTATASEARAFGSACHGAGRAMSRHMALKRWKGRQLVDELASQGIVIAGPSLRGIAEEAPGAYKPVDEVVQAAHQAGLARMVARVEPLVCLKG